MKISLNLKKLVGIMLLVMMFNVTGTAFAVDISGEPSGGGFPDDVDIPDDKPDPEDLPLDTGCEDDMYEPLGVGNDVLPLAVGMAEGTYSLKLCKDSRQDWYSLDLAEGETLSTEIRFDHAAADLILELWSEDGQLVMANRSSSIDGTESAEYTTTQAEKLYIGVSTLSTVFITTDYALDIGVEAAAVEEPVTDDAYEPNNSILAWKDTDEVIRTTLMPGTYDFIMSDEADYFVLPGVIAGSKLNIELANFEGAPTDLDLHLLDSTGSVVYSASNTDGATESIDQFDPADLGAGSGNYYLLVENVNGVVNMDYTLQITLTEGPDLQVVSFRYIAPEDAVANGYAENTNGYFEYTLRNKGTVSVDPALVNGDLDSTNNRYNASNRLMLVNSTIAELLGVGSGEDRVLLRKAWKDKTGDYANDYLTANGGTKKQYLDLDDGAENDFYVKHFQTGLNLIFMNADGMRHVYENNETNNWKKVYLCVDREEDSVLIKDMWTVEASELERMVCDPNKSDTVD